MNQAGPIPDLCRTAIVALFLGGCILVPSAAGSRGLADAPAKAQPGLRLRVVSFNAWCLPPPLSKELENRVARMPAALRKLDADVICLQEVWLPEVRSRLARALSPDYEATRSVAGGLLVLSRLPIVAERFTMFPHVPGMSLLETLAGKGMLDVQLKTPVGRLRIVDAHLANNDIAGTDGQLDFLLRHARTDLPLIVAADTNFWAVWRYGLTDEYESVLSHGWKDAHPPIRTADGRLFAGAPTRPGWPRGQIDSWGPTFPDHIFYEPTTETRVSVHGFRQALDTARTALSDHNALVADFSLSRNPAARKPTVAATSQRPRMPVR